MSSHANYPEIHVYKSQKNSQINHKKTDFHNTKKKSVNIFFTFKIMNFIIHHCQQRKQKQPLIFFIWLLTVGFFCWLFLLAFSVVCSHASGCAPRNGWKQMSTICCKRGEFSEILPDLIGRIVRILVLMRAIV